MKNLIGWCLLLAVTSSLWAADFISKERTPDGSRSYATTYRDMGNSTYGRTTQCESAFSYSNFNSTQVVATAAGLLHALTINTPAAQAFTVYDSTWTGDTTRPIASFAASSGIGTYFYDVIATSGIVVLCPASGPNVTVSYR